MPTTVLYLSHATPAIYALVRAAAPPGYDVLTMERDDDQERVRKLAQAEIVICASYKLRGDLIDAAPKLRLVHHQGVGYQDTVDVAALKRRGIPLCLTPEGTTVGVAEHTILLMLAVAKRLAFLDAELRQGRWHEYTLRHESRELRGRVIGYVGMGRIAQAVAQRLRAFETTGLYHDPAAPLTPVQAAALGLKPASLERVLAESDVLTVHVPRTPQTRGLIGRDALARMKPGAWLVNTARGGLVDEDALHDALASGHLGGAGLDVFDVEPVRGGHKLFALPNVVVTPHVSAATRDAFTEKMASIFANLRRFAAGEPLRNRVDL
ncbi:MAG: 2-hydroxyacid dehydrogenase [Alphaproteobacteria bacterium]|nr:2-hydroxyacid dehydrogenase [Alphaproteobacteria bacterium]